MVLPYRRIFTFIIALIIALVIIITLINLIVPTSGIILIIIPLIFIYKYRKTQTPIKVIVLGFKNAGKTVLLASMYNQLITPGQAGCILDIKPEQRNKLIKIYDQIADTQKDFPDATAPGETTEWTFTGRVRSTKRLFSVFTFTYLDFAGERGSNLFRTRGSEVYGW